MYGRSRGQRYSVQQAADWRGVEVTVAAGQVRVRHGMRELAVQRLPKADDSGSLMPLISIAWRCSSPAGAGEAHPTGDPYLPALHFRLRNEALVGGAF